jgi:hypothetical protein
MGNFNEHPLSFGLYSVPAAVARDADISQDPHLIAQTNSLIRYDCVLAFTALQWLRSFDNLPHA